MGLPNFFLTLTAYDGWPKFKPLQPFHGRVSLIELRPVGGGLSSLPGIDPTSYGVDQTRLQATQVCVRRLFGTCYALE